MRVFLAEFQPQLRSALTLYLNEEPDVELVGTADNGNSLLSQLKRSSADLLLVDWKLPGVGMTTLLTTLRQKIPSLSVVVMSGEMENKKMAQALGIDAFVSKADPPEQLLSALYQIANGGIS